MAESNPTTLTSSRPASQPFLIYRAKKKTPSSQPVAGQEEVRQLEKDEKIGGHLFKAGTTVVIDKKGEIIRAYLAQKQFLEDRLFDKENVVYFKSKKNNEKQEIAWFSKKIKDTPYIYKNCGFKNAILIFNLKDELLFAKTKEKGEIICEGKKYQGQFFVRVENERVLIKALEKLVFRARLTHKFINGKSMFYLGGRPSPFFNNTSSYKVIAKLPSRFSISLSTGFDIQSLAIQNSFEQGIMNFEINGNYSIFKNRETGNNLLGVGLSIAYWANTTINITGDILASFNTEHFGYDIGLGAGLQLSLPEEKIKTPLQAKFVARVFLGINWYINPRLSLGLRYTLWVPGNNPELDYTKSSINPYNTANFRNETSLVCRWTI